MSEYIPSTRSVMHGYVSTMNRKRDMQPMEAKAAFRRWLVEVERAAAERAWDRCVGEMPIDLDWKNFYGDNNPYHAAALGLTAGQEGEHDEQNG